MKAIPETSITLQLTPTEVRKLKELMFRVQLTRSNKLIWRECDESEFTAKELSDFSDALHGELTYEAF